MSVYAQTHDLMCINYVLCFFNLISVFQGVSLLLQPTYSSPPICCRNCELWRVRA